MPDPTRGGKPQKNPYDVRPTTLAMSGTTPAGATASQGPRDQIRRAAMGVFDTDGTDASGHEQVVFCQDRQTGLKAIIGIYSTALGPALGGTRFYPYESEDDALADVLKLSRGMAYKNALAGLD